MQPVRNNSDPLHITLGNPGLKPGINRNLRLDFHHLGTWILHLMVRAVISSNSVSIKTFTGSLGRKVSQPVNVNGGHGTAFNFTVNHKVGGFDADFHISGSYVRTVSYVNTAPSRNDVYTPGGGFSFHKYLPVFLRPFDVGTYASYSWQQKAHAFAANTSVVLWIAFVNRNFLHDKLAAKFQFDNILNCNSGITRIAANNTNAESTTNILGRHWMLSAIHHFDRKFRKK